MAKTSITIYDTTLRDGLQGSGVSLSVEDKVQVARAESSSSEHALAGVEVQNLDRQIARDLDVPAIIGTGDAFSDADLNRVNPRPNVIVVSGLHEIPPNNELIRNHFRQLFQILQAPGTLIFTIQPRHPQIELIARTLTSHSGGPWVMRLRPFALTRQWTEEAGFQIAQTQMDSQHIFGVVTAHKI